MNEKMLIDEKLILSEMDYWKVPALSLAAVRGEEKPFTAAFGHRRIGGEKADVHTAFCIASCSKAMTSALIAILVSEGTLDYDTPVTAYVPEFSLADPEASAKTTLRDILCHQTGVGGHDGIWPVPEGLSDFTARFRHLAPSAPFRAKAQYSNIMYALAGCIAERATGKNWSELMKEYLFSPLSMNESSCTADVLTGPGNCALPYQVVGGKLTPLSVWNVDTVAPAASVNTTASDMVKWLRFLADGGIAPGGERRIAPAVFAEMIAKQTDFQDFIADGFYPTDGYAFGWQTGVYKGKRICKHTGKIEGYSSIHAFLPEERIGAAIMLNLHSPTVPIMHVILYTLLDALLGFPQEDWQKKFHGPKPPSPQVYDDCAVDVFRQRYPDAMKRENIDPASLRKYIGEYQAPGYGRLTICQDDGALSMKFRQSDVPLSAFWGELFCAEGFREDILTFRLPVTFTAGPQGEITSVQIPFEPAVADISFRRV